MRRFFKNFSNGTKRALLAAFKAAAPFVPGLSGSVLISRTACLGNDLLRRRRKKEFSIAINQQKVRADLFLEWLAGQPRPQSRLVKKYVKDRAIFEHIRQQEKLPWLKIKKIKCLVMDSFSELTDKKFTHKNGGWSFCCHYGDLDITEEFKKDFSISGLLPLEELETSYQKLFTWFNETYPGKDIFFIHYPAMLEQRSEYRERGQAIRKTLEKIAEKNPHLKNIFLPEESAPSRPEKEAFPYHYDEKIYLYLLKKWEESSAK